MDIHRNNRYAVNFCAMLFRFLLFSAPPVQHGALFDGHLQPSSSHSLAFTLTGPSGLGRKSLTQSTTNAGESQYHWMTQQTGT